MGEEEKSKFSIWPGFGAITICVILVGGVFSAVGYLTTTNASISNTDPPHIVFILADDLGWNDVSFHGSPQIPTPNLDALAASGIILNNYYVLPQCTPSRGAFLSGKYPMKIGLQHHVLLASQPTGLPLDIVTLPQHLKRLGYANHLVGKWHLGYYTKEYLPTRRGFDSFFGYLNGFLDYYDYTHYSNHWKPEQQFKAKMAQKSKESEVEDGVPVTTPSTEEREELPQIHYGIDLMENENIIRNFRSRYATEVFTEKAVNVISNHNTSQPLFLLVNHLAPHIGNPILTLQAPNEYISRNQHIQHPKRRIFAGMISSLDDSVGAIFQALNEKNMLNNTIFLFSSDNGAEVEGHIDTAGSNWPLRGSKMYLWEGGVRVPGILWSPLLKLQQPRISKQMMHMTDWLPTLYSVAGGDVDDLGDIDGMDMWNSLADDSPSPREEILLNIDPVYNMSGLRQGHLKLLDGNYIFNDNRWHETLGQEDLNITSMDDWVWKNGSLIRDILLENDLWLIQESDTWRKKAEVTCGENFLPETGNCDPTQSPCLYNVTRDPCEYYNLAPIFPELVTAMLNRVNELKELSVLPLCTIKFDNRGDPLFHDFAFVPWLDESEASNSL